MIVRLLLATTALVLINGLFAAGSTWAATIRISCGAVGREIELCRSGSEAWAKKAGHQVEVIVAPSNSNDRLGLYLQLLAAQSHDVDVFVVDTTWPGIFSGFFVDLSEHYEKKEREQFFPAFVKSNTVGNRFVAVPWYMDAGLLYYRKDLLKKYNRNIPKTWQELTDTAKFIQQKERAAGNKSIWGYVFQARAYEGLTCNALEWISSFGGGDFVNDEGKVTINNPNAKKALEFAKSWVGTISPRGVLNYAEEEARGVFQTGNAVFMRNWPYVISLADSEDSPIQGLFDISPLPQGEPFNKAADGRSSATLGGWSLAVSKYSKNKKAAIDLVRYLASSEEQIRRAQVGGFYPTRQPIYDDPRLKKSLSHLAELKEIMKTAVPRPSQVTGRKYNQVSAEVWEGVHQVLTGKKSAEASLKQVEKRLQHISRQGRW